MSDRVGLPGYRGDHGHSQIDLAYLAGSPSATGGLSLCSMACVSVDEGGFRFLTRPAHDQVRLADAEQMIDDLDRIMTGNGTIGVQSPDVWGQDRLAKFRSEYEAHMSDWLKTSFKGDINASVRRTRKPRPTALTWAHRSPRFQETARRRKWTRPLRTRWPSRWRRPTLPHSTQPAPPTRRRSLSSRPWCSTSIRIILNHLNQLRRSTPATT